MPRAPTLRFALRIDGDDARRIRSVLLSVQVQIAAPRRRYDEREQERLVELFGPPERWGTTLRRCRAAHDARRAGVRGHRRELDVPCTYDLEVAASRYLDALPDGDVPLELASSAAASSTSARAGYCGRAGSCGRRSRPAAGLRRLAGGDRPALRARRVARSSRSQALPGK